MKIIQEYGHYVAYDAGGVFICSGDTYNEVVRELENENREIGYNTAQFGF